MLTSSPLMTSIGDDEGSIIDPFEPAFTVSVYVGSKFAWIVASLSVSVIVVFDEFTSSIVTPVPLSIVHWVNV